MASTNNGRFFVAVIQLDSEESVQNDSEHLVFRMAPNFWRLSVSGQACQKFSMLSQPNFRDGLSKIPSATIGNMFYRWKQIVGGCWWVLDIGLKSRPITDAIWSGSLCHISQIHRNIWSCYNKANFVQIFITDTVARAIACLWGWVRGVFCEFKVRYMYEIPCHI